MESLVPGIKQEELHITDYGDSYVEDIKPNCSVLFPPKIDGTACVDLHTLGSHKSSLTALKPVSLELVKLDDWYPEWSRFAKVKQELCDDEDTDQDPLAFSLDESMSKFGKIKIETRAPATLQIIKMEKEEIDLEVNDATVSEDWYSELTSTDVNPLDEPDLVVKREVTSPTPRLKVTTDGSEMSNKVIESIVPCLKEASRSVSNKNNHNKSQNKLYECEICPKTYCGKKGLAIHMMGHLGVAPFICAYCNKSFREKGNLAIHIRTHTQERPYSCNVCSKTFRTRGAMTGHQQLHTGLRPFSCYTCGKSYAVKHVLVQHIKNHVELLDEKNRERVLNANVCKICGNRYPNACLLRRHIVRLHSAKTFACGKCEAKFSENYKLQRHLNSHKKARSYLCTLCDFSFTCQAYLTNHTKKIHSQKNCITCELCSEKFSSKLQLKKHLKRCHLECDPGSGRCDLPRDRRLLRR